MLTGMTGSNPTRLTVLTAAILVAAGCTTAGEAAPPATGAPAPTGTIAEALAVVPSGVASFTVTDHQRRNDRWGVPDISSADVPDSPAWDTWSERSVGGVGGTLGGFTAVMAEEWGWSELDLRWEADLHRDGGQVSTVLAFEEDVDMQVVVASLEGNERSGPDDRPFFRLSPGTAEFFPFFAATVLPDRHLVVLGQPDEQLLALIDGEGTSVATDSTTTTLVGAVGPADRLLVTTGALACTDPLGGAPTRTPEEMKRLAEQFGERELAPLTSLAIALVDDETATVLAGYADDATAAADLPRRTALWEEGVSLNSGQPYTEIVTLDEAVAEGAAVRYSFSSPDRGPATVLAMWGNRDAPWAFC